MNIVRRLYIKKKLEIAEILIDHQSCFIPPSCSCSPAVIWLFFGNSYYIFWIFYYVIISDCYYYWYVTLFCLTVIVSWRLGKRERVQDLERKIGKEKSKGIEEEKEMSKKGWEGKNKANQNTLVIFVIVIISPVLFFITVPHCYSCCSRILWGIADQERPLSNNGF